MSEFATTGGLIDVARRFLEVFEFECRTADAIREGDPRFRSLSPIEHQNITRSAIAARIWKREGRQVLAMHPEVVREISVASSDKVSGKVLRRLPYLSPMVLYPSPPVFRSWIKSRDLDSPEFLKWRREHVSYEETALRLLGFLTFSNGELGKGEDWAADLPAQRPRWKVRVPKRAMYEVFDESTFTTHDDRGLSFGIAAVFDVVDGVGNHLDYETNLLSIPFDRTESLRSVVTHMLERFEWTTAPGDDAAAQKWMRQIMSTIVGTLFYLCSTSLESSPLPRKQAAKITPGLRKPLNVQKVGWKMGTALTRLRHQSHPSGNVGEPGREQDPQHRKGHFRMQWYGPLGERCEKPLGSCDCGRQHSEFIYIEPYWTHRELLGAEGAKTIRAVPRVGPEGMARRSVHDVIDIAPYMNRGTH